MGIGLIQLCGLALGQYISNILRLAITHLPLGYSSLRCHTLYMGVCIWWTGLLVYSEHAHRKHLQYKYTHMHMENIFSKCIVFIRDLQGTSQQSIRTSRCTCYQTSRTFEIEGACVYHQLVCGAAEISKLLAAMQVLPLKYIHSIPFLFSSHGDPLCNEYHNGIIRRYAVETVEVSTTEKFVYQSTQLSNHLPMSLYGNILKH